VTQTEVRKDQVMNTGPAVTMDIEWTLANSTRNELLDMNVNRGRINYRKQLKKHGHL
jgi:hypothetical protein